MNKPMFWCVESGGRALCLVRSPSCVGLSLITVNRESAAPSDSPLCLLDHRTWICVLTPFQLLYLWGEGVIMDVFGKIFVTEWKFIFLEYICWTNGNAQMSDFMLCFLIHPPACAPSFRPCPVCVRVRNVITWLKGKIFQKICLSRTLFVMSASFKGAISCQLFFFLAVNVPSNDYLCDVKRIIPVA